MTAAPCRLAVIVPCFNYARFVGRAIESVLSQGRPDVDLLVVDDGSTDGSWTIIESFGLPQSSRVPNGGALKACLAAAEKTQAEFILVLDADDELKPGSLDRILLLLTPDVAKLQFTLSLIDGDGAELGAPAPQLRDFTQKEPLIAEIRATGSYTNPPTSGNVFRRDVFDLLAGVDYERYVDGVPLFAAPFMGHIVSLSTPLGCYRLHSGNASGIGNKPDPVKIEAELSRFVARLDHLCRILERRGVAHELPRAEETFFFRERSLFLAVAQRRRPSVSKVVGVLAALRRQPMSLKRKAGLAVFALISLIAPPSRAMPALTYRTSPGRRSALGLLRTLVTG